MTILGRSEELVSRCVECDLAEPESLSSLGGSAPGVVDGILSPSGSLRSASLTLGCVAAWEHQQNNQPLRVTKSHDDLDR